jgi:hypothetical protein
VSGTTATDEYERIGEFHDLFVPPLASNELPPPLGELFGGLSGQPPETPAALDGACATQKHRVRLLTAPVPPALGSMNYHRERFVRSATLGHLYTATHIGKLCSLANTPSADGADILAVRAELPQLAQGMREDTGRIGARDYIESPLHE